MNAGDFPAFRCFALGGSRADFDGVASALGWKGVEAAAGVLSFEQSCLSTRQNDWELLNLCTLQGKSAPTYATT
jgi:hypothetical protein